MFSSNFLEKEISKLSKNRIIEVFNLFNKNWWTIDSLWFSTIENEFGIETAERINWKVSEAAAPLMAKRIMKSQRITGKNLSELVKALRYVVWTDIQEIKAVKESKDSIILRIVN